MDDQQHALSALLRTRAVVGTLADDADGADAPEPPAPAALLWIVALVAALNPVRAALAVPREDRRSSVRVAALGGVVGSAVVLLLAMAGGPLLDALDVSDPAFRIAAGAVAAIAGGLDLVRRPPSAEPSLPGWRAALVPVAVPLVIRPALVLGAVSAHADRGIGVVAAALADRGGGPGGRHRRDRCPRAGGRSRRCGMAGGPLGGGPHGGGPDRRGRPAADRRRAGGVTRASRPWSPRSAPGPGPQHGLVRLAGHQHGGAWPRPPRTSRGGRDVIAVQTLRRRAASGVVVSRTPVGPEAMTRAECLEAITCGPRT